MTFDWTITLGNLLSILGFLGGGLAMFYGMRADIRILNQRMGGVEVDLTKIDDSLKQIVKVTVEIARQDERLSSMDRRMNDLANRLLAVEGRSVPPHNNPGML